MKKRDSVVYSVLIVLSALDMAGILLSGIVFLNKIRRVILPAHTAFGYTAKQQMLPCILWGVLFAGLLVLFPVLEKWRRKYRDRAEYTKEGISKKNGIFENLSGKQRQTIEQQKMMDNERILDSVTFSRMVHKGSVSPEEDMKNLTGLAPVRSCMHEMSSRMAYEYGLWKKEKRKGKFIPQGLMHMAFTGPPGTGKTTCARIMTGFLYKNHYIQKNQCVETDGSFLLGNTPGESSKKVKLLMKKSMGGVLFIDEAYALLKGGDEITAAIVKVMEDEKDHLVFIFAGYEEETRRFLESNPGLCSRVKYHLPFCGFSPSELWEIFQSMAHAQGYCVSAGFFNRFNGQIQKEMKKINFGNARTIKVLLDKTIDRHAVNFMDGKIKEKDRYVLMEEDMPDEV